jgi:hypothetical protein
MCTGVLHPLLAALENISEEAVGKKREKLTEEHQSTG